MKDIKGGNHVLHAVFKENDNGVKFKCINSWGTNWQEIMIPMNKFEKREVEVVELE